MHAAVGSRSQPNESKRGANYAWSLAGRASLSPGACCSAVACSRNSKKMTYGEFGGHVVRPRSGCMSFREVVPTQN